jgi:hypothetical protein
MFEVVKALEMDNRGTVEEEYWNNKGFGLNFVNYLSFLKIYLKKRGVF